MKVLSVNLGYKKVMNKREINFKILRKNQRNGFRNIAQCLKKLRNQFHLYLLNR